MAFERQLKRGGMTLSLVIAAALVVIVGVGWCLTAFLVTEPKSKTPLTEESVKKKSVTHLSDVAKRDLESPTSKLVERPPNRYLVTVRPGPSTPRIVLPVKDQDGKSVTASCRTCHATRPANRANRKTSDLNEFHQGLEFSHNDLSCLSCHNAADYETLQLADGTAIDYANVMTLCAQCHGPQFRDFEHGAHGGMTGYWDLSRGPRTRNNCIDCHHPHTPEFPKMKPTFKPRDRFLNHEAENGSDTHDRKAKS